MPIPPIFVFFLFFLNGLIFYSLVLVFMIIKMSLFCLSYRLLPINYMKPVPCKKASNSEFCLVERQWPTNFKHHFQHGWNQKTPWCRSLKLEKWMNFQKKQFFSLPSALHVVFSFLFLNLALQEFYFSQLVYKHNRKYKSDQMLNFLIMHCAVHFAAVLCKVVLCSIPVSLTPGSLWGNWGSFKVLL